ncbi:MAG: dTMP kinase [Candidatus Porifericomitaceae bacterium WSBS_2022_MAG_OTU9]
MSGQGSFIVLEGIDGCGKSTQAQWLKTWLQQHGHQVQHLREPGSTSLGEQLRGLFLGLPDTTSPRAELLLLFAARAQLLHERIEPALAAGETVLCERFITSSHAYQGEQGAGVAPEQWIVQLQQFISPYPEPDMVLLFDLPAELAIKRRTNSDKADKYSSKDIVFIDKVRQCYLQQAAANDNMHVVNVSQPLAQVQADLQRYMAKYV